MKKITTKNELLEQLKKEYEQTTGELSEIAKQFINDYKGQELRYLSDSVNEFSDNNVSIYNQDNINFYLDYTDLCDIAIQEYYGGLDYLTANDCETVRDLIVKAGQIGQYYQIETELYNNIYYIVKSLILYNLIELLKTDKTNYMKLHQIVNLQLEQLQQQNTGYCTIDYIPKSFADFENILL